MPDARRNDLVQIHKIVLEPHQRPHNLPFSTKSVPYECWIKGFLLDESAEIGDRVTIRTFIGRELSGVLHRVNPTYDHDFGTPQKEILPVGFEALQRLRKVREEG